MGTYVTPQGFKGKTHQEIRAELTEGLKAVFGPTFETAVESPNGHLISQLSLALANLWQLAAEVYASRDPAQAEGVALDWAAALSRIGRKAETPCRVRAMLYTDSESADVPAGSLARRSRGALDFALDEDVSISRSGSDELVIVDTGAAAGNSYTFSFLFGGQPFTFTDFIPQGTPSVIARLMTDINRDVSTFAVADPYPGRSDAIRVRAKDGTIGIAGTLPEGFSFRSGAWGDFTAVRNGTQTCEAGELDAIPVVVEGWDAVRNWDAGIPGTDTETDTALRLRQAAAARAVKSSGTDPALETHLMQDVEGVTAARVVSNRTNADDASGRPPKCFECLVVGGSDEDVAKCIWQNQPAGIQSYGNTSVEITDDNGDGQVISFSRPQAKYLWVKVTYSLYTEESAPTDAEIRAAIMQWSQAEYQMGTDVIPTRVLQGLYSGTTGIGTASIQVAVTDTAEGTPSYGTFVIPIAPSDYAVLATSRIALVRT